MENTKREVWKDIEGFEGRYQISNKGRVKSLERKITYKNGVVANKSEMFLSQSVNAQGYLTVSLYKNNKGSTKNVHRLIAEAFIPNPENKPYVCHKNDIKTDNRLSNLYWGTSRENVQDMFANGYVMSDKTKKKISENSAKGEENHNSKLTEKDVIYIRENREDYTLEELASKFDVHPSLISLTANKQVWKHI